MIKVMKPAIALRTILVLHPKNSATNTHTKRPMIPPIAWAEFSNPMPRPSDCFPKYSEISITLGPKKKAIPNPTINLSTAIDNKSMENAEKKTALEAIAIPRIAIFLGEYLAARIPART
jgi:hypothetical protein